MKNTAPPRALRGQGLTGAAPPMPKGVIISVSGRGGCGRHAPPPIGRDRAGSRGAAAWGKHEPDRAIGKPMQTRPANTTRQPTKTERSDYRCAERSESPQRGVPDGAPGSTPGAGARQGQRGQQTRTATTARQHPPTGTRCTMRHHRRKCNLATAVKTDPTQRTMFGGAAAHFATRRSVARAPEGKGRGRRGAGGE